MTDFYDRKLSIKLKTGLDGDINTSATQSLAAEGEPHWTTDTDELYVFNGTKNVRMVRLDDDEESINIPNDSAPSSASDTGAKGQIKWDVNYIYICTATDTWKRTAIATW
jgi:hypothetical protein